MHGYPSVTALDTAGRPAQQARDTSCGYLLASKCGSVGARIALAPGKDAWVLVEGTALSKASSCPVYPSFSVAPPGASNRTRLRLGAQWTIMAGAVGMPGCGRIVVNAVVAGSSGS